MKQRIGKRQSRINRKKARQTDSTTDEQFTSPDKLEKKQVEPIDRIKC